MNKFSLILIPLLSGVSLFAAETSQTSESMREKLGVMIREDAKDGAKKQVELPKKKSEGEVAKTATDKPKDEKVVAMPQVNVQGRRVPRETETTYEAKVLVEKIEKQVEKEKKATKATEADNALNSSKISYLGDRSAAAGTDAAKLKVRELEMKEAIAATAVDPTKDAENKKLLQELKELEYLQKRQEKEKAYEK